LSGKLRTAKHAQGRLWLRIDHGDVTGFFDNMARNPVISESWTKAQIVGDVDADATQIVIGTLMRGEGTAWYDDLGLEMETKDGWRAIEIQNGDFEAADALTGWHPGIGRSNRVQSLDGWNVILDHGQAASGGSSLRIEGVTRLVTEELFEATPQPGDFVDIELGQGMQARVPIALYSKNNRTLGDDPKIALATQLKQPPMQSKEFEMTAGVADVIVVWNVLEHFWPYWNDISVDWFAELDAAISDALNDRSVDDHVITLRRLSAAAPDAHATTSCPGESERAFLPFAVDLVEDHVVVTASTNGSIERGDVVVSLNGQAAKDILAAEEALVSGSVQWRHVAGLARFGEGPVGSTVIVQIRRRNTEQSIAVARIDHRSSEEASIPAIKLFDDGMYYVDLSRVPMVDIDAVMQRLSEAPGVIFDIRGRPNSNHQILSHLFVRPDDANAWMAIPLLTLPDHRSLSSWETSGWSMPVLQPHIGGRIAFLTGPGAVSYSESVMGFVEYYRLGQIVGATTAGTNGDIAQISEPTGCRTIFTGRRVTKLDGSRHHLVGVQPTISVSRTIAGVVAGRDEVLERALAYVRESK
jgi:hypothetical protein